MINSVSAVADVTVQMSEAGWCLQQAAGNVKMHVCTMLTLQSHGSTIVWLVCGVVVLLSVAFSHKLRTQISKAM